MIPEYLKYGSVSNDYSYTIPTYLDIEFEEAVSKYESIIEENISILNRENPVYTLSGGIDSSLIFSFLNKPKCFCAQVNGNDDYYFASKLCPGVKKNDGFNYINLEDILIELQTIWDNPHCMRSDIYDYYVYNQYNLIVVGEDPNHVNAIDYLNKGRPYIHNFIKEIEVFSNKEIEEFGYNIPKIELKRDSIIDVVNFVYDWWTKVNRKIFFRFENIKSPYMMDNATSFYKSLPLKYQCNKKLVRELVRRRLPQYILDRPKRTGDSFNRVFMSEHSDQLTALKEKYLIDKNKNIFHFLDYNLVQKHLVSFKKMWRLLNLAIWLEIKKSIWNK